MGDAKYGLPPTPHTHSPPPPEETMWDLIFIALTIALFAIAIAYTRGCDKV